MYRSEAFGTSGEWESDGKVLAVYQGVENKGELIAKGAQLTQSKKSARANRGEERDTKFNRVHSEQKSSSISVFHHFWDEWKSKS